MKRKRGLPLAAVVCAAALASPVALAAGFDGKSNLVCAATDVLACAEPYGCAQGRPGTFETPDFMFVDFKAKVVHATTLDEKKRVESRIRTQEASERALIIQGIENSHGWTLSIDRNSGRMTTSVSGGALSYIILGVCTPI